MTNINTSYNWILAIIPISLFMLIMMYIYSNKYIHIKLINSSIVASFLVFILFRGEYIFFSNKLGLTAFAPVTFGLSFVMVYLIRENLSDNLHDKTTTFIVKNSINAFFLSFTCYIIVMAIVWLLSINNSIFEALDYLLSFSLGSFLFIVDNNEHYIDKYTLYATHYNKWSNDTRYIEDMEGQVLTTQARMWSMLRNIQTNVTKLQLLSHDFTGNISEREKNMIGTEFGSVDREIKKESAELCRTLRFTAIGMGHALENVGISNFYLNRHREINGVLIVRYESIKLTYDSLENIKYYREVNRTGYFKGARRPEDNLQSILD